MPRRNSHRNKLAAHASYLSAERALASRAALRLDRKVVRAATDDLARALSSGVVLGQSAAPPPPADADMAARTARARKRNSARKKHAERLRKVAARRDERAARGGDVEMREGGGELRGREGRSDAGVGKRRTVSAGKGRRVERKARAKRLMREMMVADVADGEVVEGED